MIVLVFNYDQHNLQEIQAINRYFAAKSQPNLLPHGVTTRKEEEESFKATKRTSPKTSNLSSPLQKMMVVSCRGHFMLSKAHSGII